jgi:uncharacterized protein YndB with AHSA1/START domain
MLIDEVLAAYEAALRYEVIVEAPAPLVYHAIVTADLRASPWLRVFRPPSTWLGRWNSGLDISGQPPFRLLDARRLGILVLAERPPEGVTLGAVARLWSVRPSPRRIPPEFFASVANPGYVKVAATLEAIPLSAHRSLLACEVRFQPLDAAARRRFRLGWPVGWLVTRLIRHAVLSVIRRRAESMVALPAAGR